MNVLEGQLIARERLKKLYCNCPALMKIIIIGSEIIKWTVEWL